MNCQAFTNDSLTMMYEAMPLAPVSFLIASWSYSPRQVGTPLRPELRLVRHLKASASTSACACAGCGGKVAALRCRDCRSC
jgi:hypothetical protein